MDFLAGYGSGSEGEEEEEQLQAPEAKAPASTMPPPRSAVGHTGNEATRGTAAGAGQSQQDLFSGIPEPSTSQVAGLAALPPPTTTGGRRVVRMQLPMRKELLAAAAADSDDDETPVAKRMKQSTGDRSRLMDFLPPPKHAPAGGAPTRGLLGSGVGKGPKAAAEGGSGSGAHGGAAAGAHAGGSGAASGSAAAAAGGLPAGFFADAGAVAYGNEAFRVQDDDEQAAGAAAGAHGYADPYAAQHYYPHAAGYQQQHAYAGYAYPGQHGAAPGAAPGHPGPEPGASAGPSRPGGGSQRLAAAVWAGAGDDEEGPSAALAGMSTDELFQRALQEEQERAKRGGGKGGGKGGAKLVEISAKDLTHMDPAQRQAANATREALGSDYALQLRASAGSHEGSKLARRKHQIGTLLYNAKMQELDLLEKKSQGQKTKAETAAKYGW